MSLFVTETTKCYFFGQLEKIVQRKRNAFLLNIESNFDKILTNREVFGLADSNITKKALAQALKGLMEEEEFSKISVADICNRCGMNRKSFYYHFKDKYDLVNWIFDIEFLAVVNVETQDNTWELLEKCCNYFYENKSFYRNALKIKGQNSLEEHFIDLLIPVVEDSVRKVLGDEVKTEFYINFCIDAFFGSIKRWIMDKNCVEPKEFLEQVKSCIHIIGVRDEEFYSKQ